MTNLYSENYPHMSPVWFRIFPLESERAEGPYIFTQDGRKYLDFTCGIGVTNTGHCHPKVVEAVREQAGKFLHAQANIVVHKPMMELIAELRTIVPQNIDGFFFSNSGAEAVEGALKLARNATGRNSVIVFSGSALMAGGSTWNAGAKRALRLSIRPLFVGKDCGGGGGRSSPVR